MIIDLATINFAGGGGGGTPAKLQEKTVGIMTNGTTVIAPDEGFNGLSEVEVNVAIAGPSSAIDFSSIGYDDNLSAEVNAQFNDDVAYSKTLYDKWNPSTTNAQNFFMNNKKLVYLPAINTSNVYNMRGMFNGCINLKVVPLLNTSKVTDMDSLFYTCSNLITIPLLDTSNVTDLDNAFNNCQRLTTIPLLDTSKATRMESLFFNCSNLITIPQIDTSNVITVTEMFYDCKNLTTIPLLDFSKVNSIGTFFGYTNITTLTNLGGFKGLKINWTSYGLSQCPNLTYESVMNVINNLYDFRGNGYTSTTKTIKFHANSLALLSDADKAIATSKGWILS